mgnify:CR=1 FL=1
MTKTKRNERKQKTKAKEPVRQPITQREADDTAHSARMAAKAPEVKVPEAKVDSTGTTVPSYGDPALIDYHTERASALAIEAEYAFDSSRKKASSADMIVAWGEAKVMAKLAQAHAEAARALKEAEQ